MNIKDVHNKRVLSDIDEHARVLVAQTKAAEMWLNAEFPTVSHVEQLEQGLLRVVVAWPKTTLPDAAPLVNGHTIAIFNEHGGFVRYADIVGCDQKDHSILVNCPPIAAPVEEGPDISVGDFIFQLP